MNAKDETQPEPRKSRAPVSNSSGTQRPDDNVIRVSANRNTRFWTFLAKVYLKRNNEIELHAFGDAISTSVRVAENLQRFGYCEFTRVNTETSEVVRRQ
jgi:hypothetical protein